MSSQPNSCGCGGAGCSCGCCDGIRAITPVPVYNLPGQGALRYRAGTRPTFLETMIAGLTSAGEEQLRKLGTRNADDPSIAFLDGWATVADILTFYQERIANEGYLRTAVERRSVLELARLVGYRPRPGVSASVYLAYTIDPAFAGEAIIPVGTRSTSVPAPGETQQTFETSDELRARAKWNVLQPRLTRPQTLVSITGSEGRNGRIYLQGIAANFKANDPILIAPNDLFRVSTVSVDPTANRTLVGLLDWKAAELAKPAAAKLNDIQSIDKLALNAALFAPRSIPPASQAQMLTSLKSVSPFSDASFRVFDTFSPETAGRLQQAVESAAVTPPSAVQAYRFNVKASLFASNSPGIPTTTISSPQVEGPKVNAATLTNGQVITTTYTEPTIDNTVGFLNPGTSLQTLALDAEYNQIKVGDFLLIDFPNPTKTNLPKTSPAKINPARRQTRITTVSAVETRTLSFAGVATKVTLITFPEWKSTPDGFRTQQTVLRGTIVYAQSELLPLADEVIPDPICGGDGEIELDSLYSDLQPGRWLIIAGERTDIAGTSSVQSTELLMLSEVRHGVALTELQAGDGALFPLPGDKLHTFIKVATPLAYCYRRDKCTIYGNVVHATHGETRRETLGNGDAAHIFQQVVLKQSPLTYVSAPTVSGVESTLQVIVNDLIWHESDSLAGLKPTDHAFVTKTADDNTTTVIFGDGVHGARTPTGLANLRAIYRNGIGTAGNLAPLQISQLGDRPLGVKDVVNPQESSGGADPESRDQARRNVPIATIALDRLVSVQDYADFCRTFAGVAKAAAAELPGLSSQIVHVTIAGLDDIPIDESSDLFRNLRTALICYGGPIQPVQLGVRDRILLVMSANVKVKTDYLWDKVEPAVRAAVLNTFSFDNRDLGQPAFLSEVIAAMQNTEGVEYVDVDAFGGVPGLKPDGTRLTPTEISLAIQAIADDVPASAVPARLARTSASGILPAQVAYFATDQTATLTLNEVKS